MATASAPARPVSAGSYGPERRPAWLDVDWREHQRWIDVDGHPVNVIEIGEGPPVVFVHGHSGCWQNWLENLLPAAEAGHRAIAFDLPGFGASEKPDRKLTIEGWARDTDVLFEALDIDSAALVGNSLGGFIAAQVAISHPTRVGRLVLVTAAGVSDRYIGLPSKLLARNAVARFERLLNSRGTIPKSQARMIVTRPRLRRAALGFVVAYPERLPAVTCMELLRGAGHEAVPDATAAIMTYDFSEHVPSISCPTMIVWGERDRLVSAASADRYEELIDGARKIVYADTGHMPQLERPARFNADLEAFLAE
jgi:pimeloyl-ACP methyl ester carboxylesterase